MDKVFSLTPNFWLVSVRLLCICIEYRLISENISGFTADVKRGKIVTCETASTCSLVMDCMQTAQVFFIICLDVHIFYSKFRCICGFTITCSS